MNFFPGQGKVREFYGWPGKFRKDLESQGKSGNLKINGYGRQSSANLCILFKKGTLGSKFLPFRVTPKFEVIHLTPLK